MTKDEMRTAALEANNENAHIYYRNGFLHGFDAGYDAAMSQTCEWARVACHAKRDDGSHCGTYYELHTACGKEHMECDTHGEPFCPNCGGRVVVKEAR